MAAETDLRALDLFERLLAYPGNERFRRRLLKNEPPAVMERLARLEAGHAARAAMPTELPDWIAAPMVEPPGQIGPFRLVERIGQGGMGDVWRGERNDGLFEQQVAIKLIQGNLGPEGAKAFEAERRILARLNHPDIVRLIDGGITADGLPYLIMEHVEGVPFDAAIAPLDLRARMLLFSSAVQAVQFAHGRLIAHADLKPSNILVDTEGRVRLLDFGIAALLGGEDQRARPVGAMTREFASPERRAGAPPSVQDDVYALGRLLALALEGVSDPDLSAIAAKATAPQDERYDAAAELSGDVEHWLQGLPVSALPDTPAYRMRKFVARHRAGVLASILAVLALVGATFFATVSSIRAEAARKEAAARFEDARGTARYLLFTLMDRLEAQPNSLTLRKEVAEVAQHYLDRLSKAQGAAPEVRLEAARGLIRLAEAQGVPGLPNLAQPKRAEQSLSRALEIAKGTADARAGEIAVLALSYQARLASLVTHDAALSERLLNDADAMASKTIIPPLLKARLLNDRAVVAGFRDDYAKAVALARQAEAALPPAGDLETQLERAKSADIIAEGIYYSQTPQAAVPPYQEALARYEAAQARHPASRTLQERMERARWGLASTLLSMNRNRDALALLEDGHQRVSKMVAFDRDDLEAARLLQIIGLDRAQATADTGNFDKAIALYEANIAGRRAWLARNPDENRRLRDLAVAVKSLGDVQARGGHVKAACATYAEFRGLVAQLSRRGNLAEMDLDYTLQHLEQDERAYCR